MKDKTIMNRYKIDDNLYMKLVYNVDTSSMQKELLHRFVTTFNVHTGQTQTYNFYINEKLYLALSSSELWKAFTKQLCTSDERVLYDANMPKRENEQLPIAILEYIVEGGW